MTKDHPVKSNTALALATATALSCLALAVSAAPPVPLPAAARFRAEVEPLLVKYCYDCHGEGMRKGKVSFDSFSSDADLLAQPKLWLAALKNVRAGMMPPDDNPRSTAGQIKRLETWIKADALGIDPANPDPGRVIVRRLNRVEYRNTIRDLMGVEFDTTAEFPPDDSGDGFDNNGEVLTVSPMLLEKYLQAAESIVDGAVPKVARIPPTRAIGGREFHPLDEANASGEWLAAEKARTVASTFAVGQTETYRVATDFEIRGSYDFHPGAFTVIFRLDGVEQFRERSSWTESEPLRYEREHRLLAGEHVASVEIIPDAAPAAAAPDAATGSKRKSSTSLSLRIHAVKLIGPLDPSQWVAPENYARFFPAGPAPTESAARARHARELLRNFATRAFRRPVDETKVAELAAVARDFSAQPGQTFETGIARAMMGVLASPRFLFRMEPRAADAPATGPAPIDEYALATRISYFLWSSMPDDELYQLAARGKLRRNLAAQVARMIRDPRSRALVENFTGQWLQTRYVDTVAIHPRSALGKHATRKVLREILPVRSEFDSFLRESMRRELEAGFDYVMREDRSVLELLDSDYAFLNERLAKLYGLPAVSGKELQRVPLPPDSPRGGVLTSGAMLTVTSNPTRTSPVKRGLFILDNILGVPPPPPPPNIPALEEAKKSPDGREFTLRELLAEHRANPVCSSCHQRMDPLGLALENFTALGTWRDTEAGQPISPVGQLATGESFASVRELKRVLTQERRLDYFRCLTEKLMTYALGRGVIPDDLQTLDAVVEKLDSTQGRFSVLLDGIIHSHAFQKQRAPSAAPTTATHPTTKKAHP